MLAEGKSVDKGSFHGYEKEEAESMMNTLVEIPQDEASK